MRLLEIPLDTVEMMKVLVVDVKKTAKTLTACGVTCLEKFCNRLIHLDLVLFLGNFLVSLLHFLVNPILEWLSYNGVDDIGYVVSRKPVNLSLDQW